MGREEAVFRSGTGKSIDLARSIIRYYDHTLFDYRSLWGSRADLAFHYGYYDDASRHHRQAVVNTNRTLARLGGVEAGHTVLDAGCGLGGSCFWLAENIGAKAVGVNLVPSQVEYAANEAKKRGLIASVEFHLADYTRTHFEQASFDVVWALESLCHSENKMGFYAEAFRILRPGGRLVVAEYMLTEDEMSETEKSLVDDWLNGWSIPSLDTTQQHLDNAVAAGFTETKVHDWTSRMRRSARRLYYLSIICHWLSLGLHRVGLRSRVAHENLLSAKHQYNALEKTLWRYKILVARKPD